ncbi:UNVERIFIED_CONTAM: protein terminal ear1 [Sesamum radiatum]|uniref:Protein terminal ear1 n=1 Tax=Sesamum radiatum TaxID=300843 RepID=A0AAW2QDD5_SESRA
MSSELAELRSFPPRTCINYIVVAPLLRVIKSCKAALFLMPQRMNPNAQEWRPTQKTLDPPHQLHLLPLHAIYRPHSQPAAAPLPPHAVVAFVPRPPCHVLPQLPYYYSFSCPSYQNLFPYTPCTRLQPVYDHSTLVSCPENGCFTPNFGGEGKLGCVGVVEMDPEEIILESPQEKKVKSPVIKTVAKRDPVAVKIARRCFPPRMRRTMRSFSVGKKPLRRQEWRRIQKNTDNGDARGGDACSPPSPLPSSKPRIEELSTTSKTTVMIKNIPNQLRRGFLLDFLDSYCGTYSLEYDFFYLPMDFRTKKNLGYAFVNFTTGGAALRFMQILQNYRWKTVKIDDGSFLSKKICNITWARIQGKAALVERFQNSRFACDDLDFLPVMLDPPRNGSELTSAPPHILGRLNRWAFSKSF